MMLCEKLGGAIRTWHYLYAQRAATSPYCTDPHVSRPAEGAMPLRALVASLLPSDGGKQAWSTLSAKGNAFRKIPFGMHAI
jgi:hypothetical protein